MGLDITAWSNIKPLRAYNGDYGSIDYDTERRFFTFTYFPHAADGLHDASVSSPHNKELVADYVYDISGSETYDWGCGAYSRYNRFRASLAEIAGYTDHDAWDDPQGNADNPFFELVNFSDCEGAIGPIASKALLQDFWEHREAYHARHSDYGQSYSFSHMYDEFVAGLDLAANNGALEFG